MFTLNSPWYELVRDGKKTYEGRRNTPKVAGLAVGQTIEFLHHTDASMPPITATVEAVLHYPTFKDALESLPIEEVLPVPGITLEAGVEIYKRYVSLQTQQKDGVVMIRLKRC